MTYADKTTNSTGFQYSVLGSVAILGLNVTVLSKAD